jgi:hypothetical protein
MFSELTRQTGFTHSKPAVYWPAVDVQKKSCRNAGSRSGARHGFYYDNVTTIGGNSVAVGAKFVNNWATSIALAARLRAKTVMTVKWIAERLQMGSPGYVNHLLYRRRKANGQGG